jgi:hypothetical protein
VTGCGLASGLAWLNKYLATFTAVQQGEPCPYCGNPLRTPKALQCLCCGMDWHDPSQVVRRGQPDHNRFGLTKDALYVVELGQQAEDFRRCVADFMAEAAQEYETICFIHLPHLPPDNLVIRALINELRGLINSTDVPAGQSPAIRESEFVKCLDLLISHKHLIPEISYINIQRSYYISKWKCSTPKDTERFDGQLGELYGSIQMLRTSLTFANLNEYRWVKAIVKRIFGIDLNDKHVRPRGVIGST